MKAVLAAAVGAAAVIAGTATFVAQGSQESALKAEPIPAVETVVLSPLQSEVAHVATPSIETNSIEIDVEQPQIIIAASAEVVEGLEPEPAGKEPVLCAFWFIQRFAEDAGLIDGEAHDIAASAYPVPAPVWIMQSLWSVGENRGT